ncbi:Chitooligosaccharide deacetylase [Azospirillaceae bacterium]
MARNLRYIPSFFVQTLWFALSVSAGLGATIESAFPASASGSAVIFSYNLFGEDRSPANSIRLDQFEAHLEELKSEDYTVLPLSRIINALRSGEPLPDRTVAITIDDASRSVFRDAFPRLRAAGVPFTLFVASDPIDRHVGTHMTWAELRALVNAGVAIGALPASGAAMAEQTDEENHADILRTMKRLQTELGVTPAFFAYPYGEYSLQVRSRVIDHGFEAAFGQQSGVASPRSDRFALPRFILNEAYGSIERFQIAANALPLPVTDITPVDPVLAGNNPPNFGFSVSNDISDVARLACFASGQGRTLLERLDVNRIEVRIADPFPPGRARINCTLPAEEGRWRWLGVQFFIPEE